MPLCANYANLLFLKINLNFTNEIMKCAFVRAGEKQRYATLQFIKVFDVVRRGERAKIKAERKSLSKAKETLFQFQGASYYI